MDEIKKYRSDHEKIKVYCPCCGKLMRGWTKDRDWDKYWIAHLKPNKKGKECWATEQQMIAIKKQWETKYEYVEDTDSRTDHN